jgi:cellulose synthase/poly-beta-1,6-N-acetylglucosamine synthase-like glycosyltransferase/peptidoglycan/xylan/chitin deacetylase (PgdA/CDA1 family)
LFLGVLGVFLINLFTVPQMERVQLGDTDENALSSLSDSEAAVPTLLAPAARLAAQLRSAERNIWWFLHVNSIHAAKLDATKRDAAKSELSAMAAESTPPRPLSIGFFNDFDNSSVDGPSFVSLRDHLSQLDWVIPSGLTLRGADMALKSNLDMQALTFIRGARPKMPILPLLQNVVEGNWDGDNLATLLANPEARKARLSEIIAVLEANNLQGLTVDLESLPESAQDNMQAFIKEMSEAFRPRGWRIVLCVPFDDADWDYRAYAQLADYLLLMAYDEHWETGAPGSIAGQRWFEKVLSKRMAELDPARTIVAIGGYGYDWSGAPSAKAVTFQDAMRIARESQAPIVFDNESANPHFSYAERGGGQHSLWFLDGATAFNEIHAADAYKPAGYALWELGSEDPSIWSVMARDYGAPAPEGLSTITPITQFHFEGHGGILSVATNRSNGERSIGLDPHSGAIVDEGYVKLPTSYVVDRYGAKPGKVALTFDDGPDPVWTPKILDILKAKGVHATFFIIGANAESAPGLLRRMVNEGHDVGNHTFSHPNLAWLSSPLVTLELNATQRLFQAYTGRSLRLLRPPFLGDDDPSSTEEIDPIAFAQSLGYLSVGVNIDSDDWQRPPASVIVQRVLDGAAADDPSIGGEVILLHDAGGDRSQTVAALPLLIDALQAKGYEIVPVSQLAGLTPDQAMPPVSEGSARGAVDRSVFLTFAGIGAFLRAILVPLIAIGLARFTFLTVLCLVGRWREWRRAAPKPSEFGRLVSVIIPAYNEAKVIVPAIERILESDYRKLEIVVVDDGSTDRTSEAVRAHFGKNRRVSLITIPNGGKANAINAALAQTHGDIVVALDADTQFAHDAISKLARWFVDPAVGAVAGNARVGNQINMITRWQALEYITAQNLERRALSALDCVTVVPGAVGAWRRAALDRLGGFPADTLAEDQDLTLAIQMAGYKVIFDCDAIALTEAPDTWSGLARQRFRWAFGTLQCLWKHRAATFRPRYGALGLVAIPQAWLFQIAISLLSPLVDLLFVARIVATAFDYSQHGAQVDWTDTRTVALYYLVFLLTDLGAGALGMVMEKGRRWSLLWWVIPQRFGYRQLMYYVVLKSVVKAVCGSSVGWNKLQRKATVPALAPRPAAASIRRAPNPISSSYREDIKVAVKS